MHQQSKQMSSAGCPDVSVAQGLSHRSQTKSSLQNSQALSGLRQEKQDVVSWMPPPRADKAPA